MTLKFPSCVTREFYCYYIKTKFSSYVTRKFYFINNSELRKINERLSMTSQFDLTRFYDVIMRNSVF